MINIKAFPLIKLLIAILIIGILFAISLPQYTQAAEKARAAEALDTIRLVRRAKRMWRWANLAKSAELTIDVSGAGQLDIDALAKQVADSKAMIASLNKSCSKNFCYDIHASYMTARRAHSSTYKYVILYRFAKRRYYCLAETPADLKFCNSLSNSAAPILRHKSNFDGAFNSLSSSTVEQGENEQN